MAQPDLTKAGLRNQYATNRDDLIRAFYVPCLSAATSYDRAVGYFRSSILLLASRAIADFAVRGGKIRLVCSPELDPRDIEGLSRGYESRTQLGEALNRIIDLAIRDSEARGLIEFLATLVAVDALTLKIAFRPGAAGIFHDKIGIFTDSEHNQVSFRGSLNETFNGWHATGNHESFDVFCSWTLDGVRVAEHVQYFENLWQDREPGVEVVHFPEVARERLVAVANPDGVQAAFETIIRPVDTPPKEPQPHQVAAIEEWDRHGCRGILQHATGSGKTITALIAAQEWLAASKPVLVLVPSDLLLRQWTQEARAQLGRMNPRILLVGGGNTSWHTSDLVEGYTQEIGEPRLTIATLQSASTPEFTSRVKEGDHLLVICDEVHRSGSPIFSQIFGIDAGGRLGLSATPTRYGDPEGTTRILDYFGGIIDTFTLADAINAGRLCHYTYHVHPVALTGDETDRWTELTDQIRRALGQSRDASTGEYILDDRTRLLLIQRARIAKKAAGKVELARRVVAENYRAGQRWLVYCDDQEQLNQIKEVLETSSLPVDVYHSAMLAGQDASLDHFMTMGGVMVAIRCLDEGVDMPSVDHALILASSRNPREFIQRRGRVLRTAPDKVFAEVHDALVMGPVDQERLDPTSLLKGEIARAAQFAENATNDSVRFQLRKIARDAGLDASSIGIGLEEDQDDES
jgi:superfamily II DNA or RNA helicase